jgi:hypothetical protein
MFLLKVFLFFRKWHHLVLLGTELYKVLLLMYIKSLFEVSEKEIKLI